MEIKKSNNKEDDTEKSSLWIPLKYFGRKDVYGTRTTTGLVCSFPHIETGEIEYLLI